MLHDYKSLLPRTVGFDRLLTTLDEFDTMLNSGKSFATYPPYNVVRHNNGNYSIEVAVAGFARDEIEISVKEDKLTVVGSRKNQEVAGEYVHRGIASRDFTHVFTLAETVIVEGADIIDGILTIDLHNVIPEEKQPRKINIGERFTRSYDSTRKELLQE